MVFESVVTCIIFRWAFLRGIECFLLRKNISNFAKATREKRFTTMTPLGMSRDVTCHRLWHHNCFWNSIKFELTYFISIWTSQILLKIRTFLSIKKKKKKKKNNFSITPRMCTYQCSSKRAGLLTDSSVDWAPWTGCKTSNLTTTNQMTIGLVSLTWVLRICWIRTNLEIHQHSMLYKLTPIQKHQETNLTLS